MNMVTSIWRRMKKPTEWYSVVSRKSVNHRDHRNQLISGDINFVWSVREEFENLNLKSLAEDLDFYLNGRLKKIPFVCFEDTTWMVEYKERESTLRQRVMTSQNILTAENGMQFLDTKKQDVDLLYTKLETGITFDPFGKYKVDPVTLLARKLEFIKQNEVVRDKSFMVDIPTVSM